jgi:hypothetical protein
MMPYTSLITALIQLHDSCLHNFLCPYNSVYSMRLVAPYVLHTVVFPGILPAIVSTHNKLLNKYFMIQDRAVPQIDSRDQRQ